jgi:hypothetical protein
MRLWITIALGLACGCGLADYEKRMDEQRERLQTMDKENEVLGELIQMPSGKDLYGNEIKAPFDIFLRPPQGIWAKFQGPKFVYHGGKLLLYRYSHSSKPDVNMFVALARVGSKTSTEKKDDEILPEDFRAKVRDALLEFFRREHGGWNANLPDFAELKKEMRQVTREGKLQSVEYETAIVDDGRLQNPSRLFVFIHIGRARQAAVVYQAPVPQAEQFRPVVDVSLKTLEISALARDMRSAYSRLK